MGALILHITNGDSTTNYLKKLKFTGDFITWREMLCEGKTTTNVGSDVFWKMRYSFFKNTYKVSKQKFIDYTIKEYRRLCNKKETKEIILWFEYDLFCQINMLAVISWLKQHRKDYHISLVCCGKVKKSTKLKGLCELSESEIHQHYKKRINLSQNDIDYADYIWQLYCSVSPLRLETITNIKTTNTFVYLENALKTHLQRFPSVENGLNNVENFVLQTATKNKLTTKNKLLGSLLKEQELFGFGDLQYQKTITQLNPLFASYNPVKLTKTGKKVLENETSFYRQLRNENSYLGGAKKFSFLFSKNNQKLLQITS